MKTLARLLRNAEFMLVVFLVCTALFGWPFISISGPAAPESMFFYLFCVWGLVIIFLYCMSRAYHPDNKDDRDDRRPHDV